jgi:hypothetical protein
MKALRLQQELTVRLRHTGRRDFLGGKEGWGGGGWDFLGGEEMGVGVNCCLPGRKSQAAWFEGLWPLARSFRKPGSSPLNARKEQPVTFNGDC